MDGAPGVLPGLKIKTWGTQSGSPMFVLSHPCRDETASWMRHPAFCQVSKARLFDALRAGSRAPRTVLSHPCRDETASWMGHPDLWHERLFGISEGASRMAKREDLGPKSGVGGVCYYQRRDFNSVGEIKNGLCNRRTLYRHEGHRLCGRLSSRLHPPQEGRSRSRRPPISCSSTRSSASTAAPAFQHARCRPSLRRTMCRRSGRTLRRRTPSTSVGSLVLAQKRLRKSKRVRCGGRVCAFGNG